MSEDRIYREDKLGDEPFRFDDSVARVFPDMLRRSIPGYTATLEAIGALAARFVTDDSRCYDLGCSLGGATLAMRQGIRAERVKIVAVDNAAAMIRRFRRIMADAAMQAGPPVEIVAGDIRDSVIRDASMVVLNYTLQFLDPADRDSLLQRIHTGLNPGGILVLSEKVVDEDPWMETLLTELYHEHKRRENYSALEIARKRAALENVLVPETVARHRERLGRAGFENVAVWLRYFNFVSIIAVRQ